MQLFSRHLCPVLFEQLGHIFEDNHIFQNKSMRFVDVFSPIFIILSFPRGTEYLDQILLCGSVCMFPCKCSVFLNFDIILVFLKLIPCLFLCPSENCPEENPLHYRWPESRPTVTQTLPCFPNKEQSTSRTW